ncbi:MAG: DUF1883 domain-containing protein [Lachnospiraceae bacterium]|nr:DUF1883 domain-containing protein [Lachnospiraceae bacterium]
MFYGDEIIEVILGTAANVHFLNSTNFNKFKYGYDFYG